MRVEYLEGLIMFVSDFAAAKPFDVGTVGMPLLFEDEIIVVAGDRSGRVVLHRQDRGHDERGIFPAGSGIGGAAVRFGLTTLTPVSEMPGRRGSRWSGPSRKPPG